jgi:hypothetical protein
MQTQGKKDSAKEAKRAHEKAILIKMKPLKNKAWDNMSQKSKDELLCLALQVMGILNKDNKVKDTGDQEAEMVAQEK